MQSRAMVRRMPVSKPQQLLTLMVIVVVGFGKALEPQLERFEVNDIDERDVGNQRRQQGVLDATPYS